MRTLNIEREGGPCLALAVPDDPQTDFVAREIFVEHCYRPLPFLTDVKLVVDVGANVGLSAAYFRLAYPLAAIHCFEPAPRTVAILETNAATIGNCRVHPYGLHGSDVKATLYLGRDGSATSSMFPHGLSSAQRIEVTLRDALGAFDALVAGGDIDVLKLDTEGCEWPILERSFDLARRARVIYVEFHSEADRRRIDGLLTESHSLWQASIASPHRGQLAYALRSAMPEKPPYDPLA